MRGVRDGDPLQAAFPLDGTKPLGGVKPWDGTKPWDGMEPWGGCIIRWNTKHKQDTWVEDGNAMPRIMGGGLLLACWVLVQCWCSAGAVLE